MWNEWIMRVRLLAVAILPGCFADDPVVRVCEERARSPAVLVVGQRNELSLQLSCDRELTLEMWSLQASPDSLGPPSGGTSLTADVATGRDFTLTGSFTPEAYWSLDNLLILATNERGMRDHIVVVDWENPP